MTGDDPAIRTAGGDEPVDARSNDSAATVWTPGPLLAVRERPRRRYAALVATALVGVGIAWIHWLGLFVAGALVGLVSESLPRALVAGLAVGGLVVVVHVGASPAMGAGEFLALAPPSYVTVAAALLAPLWGSLARAVV